MSERKLAPPWWPDVGLVLVKHLSGDKFVSRRVVDVSKMPRVVTRADGTKVVVADNMVTFSTGGNTVRRVRADSWREWQKGTERYEYWERRKNAASQIVEEPDDEVIEIPPVVRP